MVYYEIWCNLKNSHKDLEFSRSLQGFLGQLKSDGKITDFRLARRMLGFGPPELGEFHVTIMTESLAQLESAQLAIVPRSGEIEKLHAAVYGAVVNFRSALYRDFPDPQRNA